MLLMYNNQYKHYKHSQLTMNDSEANDYLMTMNNIFSVSSIALF